MMIDKSYLTVRETAEFLRTTPNTIYRLINKQKIGAIKVGSYIKISAKELERYIAASTINGQSGTLSGN